MINKLNVRSEIIKHNLGKPNNTRAFTHVCVHLGILITSLYLTYFFYERSNIWFLVFAFIYFQVFHFLGMAGLSHELLHNNVFRTSLFNRIFYKLFSLLSWNNAEYFYITHWDHHRYTLGDQDPKDLFTAKLSFLRLFGWMIFDIQGFYRRIYYFVLNAFGIVPKLKKSQIKKVQKFAILTLMFHSIVFVFSILTGNYFLVLFINLAPFIFTFLNKFLAISQHYGLENLQSGVFDDYLNNTRSINLGKVLSFFYANMNYHVEHHLFPAVPFYNLPKIQQIIIREESVNYVCSMKSFLLFFLDHQRSTHK